MITAACTGTENVSGKVGDTSCPSNAPVVVLSWVMCRWLSCGLLVPSLSKTKYCWFFTKIVCRSESV
ncbi:MAG: hypothetical protein WDN69_26610 [Aliidongia sp.]